MYACVVWSCGEWFIRISWVCCRAWRQGTRTVCVTLSVSSFDFIWQTLHSFRSLHFPEATASRNTWPQSQSRRLWECCVTLKLSAYRHAWPALPVFYDYTIYFLFPCSLESAKIVMRSVTFRCVSDIHFRVNRDENVYKVSRFHRQRDTLSGIYSIGFWLVLAIHSCTSLIFIGWTVWTKFQTIAQMIGNSTRDRRFMRMQCHPFELQLII